MVDIMRSFMLLMVQQNIMMLCRTTETVREVNGWRLQQHIAVI